jgi:multiphosphoryl transfer protein
VVGIVVVSHSAPLADGVVELARQMGGDELALEAAGGLEDGTIGTDVERVRGAIERAMSDDGVLVLMDLGSALMSAEMAVELLDAGERVVLSEAPFVEGAIAAAVAARGGATLGEVRAEAARAIEMKRAQLGVEGQSQPHDERPSDDDARSAGDRTLGSAAARIPVLNEIGLHARPAALVTELANRFNAELRLSKPGGAGPVSARSLTGLMTLVARRGDVLTATASGPQADEALVALEALARDGFGEGIAPDVSTDRPIRAPQRLQTARQQEPAAEPKPGTLLHGIAASVGIALGPVRHWNGQHAVPSERPSEGLEAETRRLESARKTAREEIERDRAGVARRTSAEDAAIFSAHLALVDDDAIVDAARARIEAGAAAEVAWHAATEEVAAAWRTLDDELLRERAADVEDVGRRVLATLMGRQSHADLPGAGILVASELTPAHAASLDPNRVHGIASARGTATAHATILARALGIPAVVGLGPSVQAISEGTEVLLNGDEGTVLVAPSEDEAQRAGAERRRALQRRALAHRDAAAPAVTRDGTLIEVSANLGGVGGAAAAVSLGADGVGLLRTEFLFLDREEIPPEDEQVQTLAQIASELDGRPLIVRTLDVGADKPLPAVPMASEQNPFLGRRGIRFSLDHPELLATQLRAVLRVAADHPLKVMFPMVATLAELEAALNAVAAARSATAVDVPLEVGIMVEVPSAALLSRQLAAKADFFSIGTNDLTQYTMAAERGNEQVGELLAGPQPALLQLVAETVAGAEALGRWVGVCGELAGDPAAAILLIGLGVRELSMAPPLVPEVKAALRSVSLADSVDAARRALDARDGLAARQLARDLLP